MFGKCGEGCGGARIWLLASSCLTPDVGDEVSATDLGCMTGVDLVFWGEWDGDWLEEAEVRRWSVRGVP